MQEHVRELLGGPRRWWLRPRVLGPFVLGLLALALAAGLGPSAPATQSIAIPLPSPTYEIVGHSGTHNISLLNLPVPYIGVPQVPIPVDVDGNLLPDITVSVNLVNVPEGLIHNPPDFDDLIAPNVEINRLLTAPVLGQVSPPLRIEVRYRISDLEGGPETVIQAGYETGPGGSIPTYWKALLGGLSDMFNPMTVKLDTRPPLPNKYEQPTYRGPLSIVGSVELADLEMDFDLHYDPLPDDIEVSLLTDDLGTHVTYNHNAPRDVDLTTVINQLASDGSKLDVNARIDRLPAEIEVDFFSAEGIGDLQYRSDVEGRAADVGASVISTPAPGSDDKPLVLDADIEGLPAEMHAHWEIPADGTMSFDFDTPGSGVGAIQAEVRDYFGADPPSFTFVPTEQQFASYHKEADKSLIRARVERIRSVSFDQIADGVDASMEIGDGQLPLEVKVVHDDFDSEGTFMDAHAIVSPLPSELNFSMRTPAPGSTGEPLTVHYDTGDSGQTADIDAEVRIVEPDTSPTACGDAGVLCAELDVRHLPAEIDATIVNVTPLDTRIAIDMVPRPGSAEPDIFASAVIAQKPDPDADPLAGNPDPIVADVSIFGLPEHMRVRMLNRVIDPGGTTEREALERAEFHACSWDYDLPTPGCTDAQGRIDAIDFSFRNFLGSANLPVLLPETPLWATVVGRGGALPTDSVKLEAKAHLTDIAEVQLLTNDDLLGLRTDVGGNQKLSALLDVEDIPIVFTEATDDDPAVYHRLDLDASVLIDPLPQKLDFCFQQKDRVVHATPTTPFTALCQNPDPFGDDDGVGNATRSPLAIAYRGTNGAGVLQEFDVYTKINLNEKGNDDDPAPNTIDDDQHIRGFVNVLHLPGSLTAFVDSPPDDENGDPTDGPLRVEYEANAPLDADQITVQFGVEITDANFLCRDPRPMPLGKMALCAEAEIENLPTALSLFYDPTISQNNFVLDTSGTERINVNDLEASLVEGVLEDRNIPETPDDESDDTLVTSVLVAFGYLHGLPEDVAGTLLLPGTVDITADPPIDEVELTIQNFIGPDPLPRDVPDQRAGVPGPAVADQQFTVFQRDEFFRAFAHVTDLRGIAFATARDAADPERLLDTNTIRIAFGDESQTVRAYADMQFFAERNPDGSPVANSLVHLIGDVTLQHVPDEVTLCIRSEVTIPGTPLDPTYCDLAPSDEEGAFSFVGDPTSALLLDIYAFVRFAKAGGTDVLATRIDMIDIPHVVQGTFRTDDRTRVEFATYSDVDPDGFGTTPSGIGSIEFDLADFDITTHGYDPADPLPWGALSKSGTVAAFPADPAGQFVRLHANPQDLHVRGEIHDLQAVLFDSEPCESPSATPPDSYPFYPPSNLGNDYTCIRAKFQNDAEERLDLHVELDNADGSRMVLRDAGFTRIPDLLQATLASTATLNPDTSLRAPCPDITPDPGAINCMAPMLRLDTSGNSTLFGMIEMGQGDVLDDVRDIDANGTLADLDQHPLDWNTWGPDNTGARLRVVSYGTDTETDSDDHSAITAGLRVAVPQSLTVDQFQTWSGVTPGVNAGHTDEASDLRFHYAVRRDVSAPLGGDDEVVTAIGELAALIHDYDKGDQTLASGTDETRGLLIPGELGLTMFVRHHVVPEENGCDDNPECHDKMFMQLEGRSSAEIDARIRIIGGDDASIQDIGANILNLPNTDGVPDDEPSFMLRVEMDKNVGEPTDELEEAFLCIVYCLQTDIGIESLNAEFDFEPVNNQPARRIDAYIVMDGAANAAEIRGYDDIDASTGDEGNRRFSAKIDIAIDPMIIFLHIGLNPILGFDLFLGGEMDISAVIDKAEEFRINSEILHLILEQEGGGSGTSVTTELSIYGLVAASFLWLFFIPPIPLYVATFLPPSPPPALISWHDCPGNPFPSFVNVITLDAGDDSEDLSAWITDPRFIRFGLLVPLVDLLIPIIFCAVGADAPLINGEHPGQPFEADPEPFHPVTGLEGVVAQPPPIPDPVFEPSLNVASGTMALCGAPALDSVIVAPGAKIVVATAPDSTPIPYVPPPPGFDAAPPQERCPAGEQGSLELNAGESIDISGRVEGPAAPGRLTITADEILVDDEPGVDGVVQAGTGKVNLQSSGTITIDGDVLADELISDLTPSNATSGGGAGHGGAGGNGGGTGTGGGVQYGDEGFTPISDTNNPDIGKVPTEAGAAGSNADGTGGLGGGTIYIEGSVVDVGTTGSVSANGGDGSDNHATNEYCAVNVHYPDTDIDTDGGGPDTDIDNSHTDLFPNTGEQGSGGGSGGGIYISAVKLTIDGDVTATGGDGGEGIAGGGGGGSGGLVKLSLALLFGGNPDVSGGVGGLSTCPPNPAPSFFPNDGNGTAPDGVADANGRPEFAAGGDGADEQLISQIGPHSSSTPTEFFFNRAETGTTPPEVDSPLEVPYVAAGVVPIAGGTNEVVLCGLHRPPESFVINDDPNDDQANDDVDPNDIDRPTGQSVLNPCGTSAPEDGGEGLGDSPTSGPTLLAIEDIPGTEAPANASFTVNNLQNGYWGLYTVILRNHSAGDPTNSCTDHSDFTLFGFGTLYDSTFCTVEALPNDPDTVGDTAVGIDNTNPQVTIDAPTVSEGVTVPVEITGVVDEMDATDGWGGDDPIPNFTGITAVECSTDNVTFHECGQGIHSVSFASSNGSQTVYVRVTDLAGNTFTATDTVVVDSIPPSSTAVLDPVVPASGWYTTAPDVEISGFADNAGGSGEPDDGVLYEWWVDGGTPTPCPAGPTCTVDLALTTGQHEFHWRAIDKAGNLEDGESAGNTFQINIDDAPPLVQLLAVPDPENGSNGWYQIQPFVVISAVDQPGASGLEDGGGPAGVYYGIDNPAAPTAYTGFFNVPPGAHTVYFRAVDVAGNQTFLGTLPTCDDEPVADSDPDPSCRQFLVDDAAPVTTIVNGAVNGTNGWHVTSTPVTLNVTDALPGSTVNSGISPSGTFMSIDGAPLQPYTGAVTMSEGLHSIVAYAVDVSGQRSEIVRRDYMVDLSPPVSVQRATPPLAARNNWWRTIPSIVLRATDGDQNAGVDSIVFRRNGVPAAFSTYTAPFDLDPGSTLIEWRAHDRSDRTEATRSRTMLVDPSPPTATALNGPLIYIRSHLLHFVLGIPLDAPLKWRVSDSLSGKITVTIKIYNLIGQMVRTLEPGTFNVTPNVPLNGSTPWDGRDFTLTGLVPAGVYYYRVIATDDAGNVAQSGESKPITITIRLL